MPTSPGTRQDPAAQESKPPSPRGQVGARSLSWPAELSVQRKQGQAVDPEEGALRLGVTRGDRDPQRVFPGAPRRWPNQERPPGARPPERQADTPTPLPAEPRLELP